MEQRLIERRFYPWLVISLCAFFLFYKYILQVSPSVMTDQLMREFKIDGTGLGNLAATYFYAYLIMQLFVGVLLDKYSPRLLTTFALGLCALGAYLFGATHHLMFAALARILIGIGTAFATVSYMKMVAVWFRSDQFAFVGGLLATAAMLGAVFGQTPLSLLVDQVGWRHSLLICGLLGLFIAVLFWIFVRDQNPKTHINNLHAEKQAFSLKEVLEVFRNKQNWLLTFYTGLAFCPVAVFGGLWGNPFLVAKYNISHTEAASYLSFIFIGLAIGSPLLGILSDKLGQRRLVMMVGSALALLALLPIIYVIDLPKWLLSACLLTFGFTTGVFMLGFALARDLNKVALAATAIALVNTGDGVLGSITEPLIGKLLDRGWSGKVVDGIHYFSLHDYQYALSLLPVYLLLALVLLFFMREPMRKH